MCPLEMTNCVPSIKPYQGQAANSLANHREPSGPDRDRTDDLLNAIQAMAPKRTGQLVPILVPFPVLVEGIGP
jgi:hypothetical protein